MAKNKTPVGPKGRQEDAQKPSGKRGNISTSDPKSRGVGTANVPLKPGRNGAESQVPKPGRGNRTTSDPKSRGVATSNVPKRKRK